MLIQSGKIAVLVVVAVILAQTLCPAHLMPAAAAGIAAPQEQSSCHPSFLSKPVPSKPLPSKPAAPNSGQKCCASPHHPEAILAARYNPTVPMAVSAVSSTPLFALTAASSASASGPAVISASLGPLVLRI
jgi:hypothetical protein